MTSMLLSTGTTAKRVIKGVPSIPQGRASVTAVIPSYNYGHFLGECVGSILSQEHVDVRVIVVDDGSTDDTPAVTRALASDERVTVIRNEPNLGQLRSVNNGLGLVESEFVIKFDADDLLADGALARATALLQAHPELSFAYGRPHHFEGPVPPLKGGRAKSWSIWPGWEWIASRCRAGTNIISQPEVVMRTAAVRAAGPIREDLPHTFDLHLWMRLATLGDVGRVNGPVQGYYRVHSASLQRTVHSGVMLDLTARRDAFDRVLHESDAPSSLIRELEDTAHRSLAAEALKRVCRAYDRARTNEVPLEELLAFACETWPATGNLPEWRALDHRRSVGADRVPRHPRFIAAALLRRASEEAGRRRWLRTGEW